MEEFTNANKIEFENPRRSKNMGDRCDEDMWKSAKAASQTNVPKNPLLYHIYSTRMVYLDRLSRDV